MHSALPVGGELLERAQGRAGGIAQVVAGDQFAAAAADQVSDPPALDVGLEHHADAVLLAGGQQLTDGLQGLRGRTLCCSRRRSLPAPAVAALAPVGVVSDATGRNPYRPRYGLRPDEAGQQQPVPQPSVVQPSQQSSMSGHLPSGSVARSGAEPAMVTAIAARAPAPVTESRTAV
jgi:hypothetical protein